MITRELGKKIKNYLKSFPIVTVVGPRQSGKTTLIKNLFPDRAYVSLEDLDNREFAQQDPRGFLATYKAPVIFDEAQKTPKLFSYLQTQSDKINLPGQYLLSGSQNFLLMEKISQSLAGRVGILTLPPLSIKELKDAKIPINNIESTLFTGFYPRIFDKKLNPIDWYPDYIQTYLERDVRQIKNISNLSLFQKFLKFCAGRTGQLLNLSSLANDCGVSHNTIRSWISILEASYIIFFLPPYYKNFNKRLIKSPKLYFYDTGLVCSLLGIENKNQLITHPLKGALFETMIVSELVKYRLNQGQKTNAYFFRDKSGHEVDFLIELAGRTLLCEIKSGQTISEDFFTNINYWQLITKEKISNSFIIYGGKEEQKRSNVTIFSWQEPYKIY